MAWKVYTVRENVRPAVQSYTEYDSKDDAVKAARNELEKPHARYIRVVLIEGPNGERIEKEELEALLT